MKKTIDTINYNNLPISDYSRRYILRMLPVMQYYESIYDKCLDMVLAGLEKPLGDVVMVDYGGGHGFLSFQAKRRGIGQVIYVDFNPKAVQTVNAISDELGYGPDVVLCGDSKVLKDWCKKEQEMPDVVMGMDVIEHIYCLDDFFAELHAINPMLRMLFTTGSNPYNKRVCRRLRKVMKKDEELFRGIRQDFITKQFPTLTEKQVDYWAVNTRGLNFDDIYRAVDSEVPNLLNDRYNTCDPSTGSWTERILEIEAYQDLLNPYMWQLHVEKGFYNESRGGIKGCASRLINRFVDMSWGVNIAPFIILNITAQR